MFLQPSAWIKPAAQRLWPTTISRPQAPFLPLQNTVRCSFCTLSIVRYCMLFRPVDQILLVNLSKTCFFSLPRGFLKSPLLHALEFYLLCTSYNPQALLRREAPTHSHLTEHIAYIYICFHGTFMQIIFLHSISAYFVPTCLNYDQYSLISILIVIPLQSDLFSFL